MCRFEKVESNCDMRLCCIEHQTIESLLTIRHLKNIFFAHSTTILNSCKSISMSRVHVTVSPSAKLFIYSLLCLTLTSLSSSFVPNRLLSSFDQRNNCCHLQPNRQNDRRTFLGKQAISLLLLGGGGTSALVPTARAEFIGSGAMISKYPDLQYLVPIYTFDNALKLLSKYLDGNVGSNGVKVASSVVDNFFKGGLLSNKNVFKGLCVVYCQEIKFDDPVCFPSIFSCQLGFLITRNIL